jgi:predicted dehydrogenase
MNIIEKSTYALVGAGARGARVYAKYLKEHPHEGKLIAVAEPNDFRRNQIAAEHSITSEYVFSDWRQLLRKPKLADAIFIASTDRLHYEPAITAANKGYHILLEKPIAPTAKECVEIVEAVKKNKVIMAVCHVLRYSPFFRKIKDIIDSGILGDICNIQHLEGVAYWHFAHSFVRGNFGNEARSSFILLQKCCHDADILRWWIGKRCLKVSSFGKLKHFRKENKPSNTSQRCIDCRLADYGCPYSSKRYYFSKLKENTFKWPLDMVIEKPDTELLTTALKEGPYGQCVYDCDNDVMDSQIVNMEFEENITASLTMCAFSPIGRRIRIMGSMGYLEGDEKIIKVLDFKNDQWIEYDVNALAIDMSGGHGGGDEAMMYNFVSAIKNNDAKYISTGPEVSLESHLIVFAAEKSRIENRTIGMEEIVNTQK